MTEEIWPEPSIDFVSLTREPDDESLPVGRVYFVFSDQGLLCKWDDNGNWLPTSSLAELEHLVEHQHLLGYHNDTAYYAVHVKPVPDTEMADLRSLFGKTDRMTIALAGRAQQVIDWYHQHQICGRCGQAMSEHVADRAMVCKDCGTAQYPRLSPSIIVLVHDGDQVLMARSHRFPEGMYSTLAGFVEPGESIEETLHREVLEEVGVTVKNLRYLGSQPWPFPNSLMLGFHAEYAGGDIQCQEEEIADARWFALDNLPQIPGRMAISRWLIDAYLKERGFPLEP